MSIPVEDPLYIILEEHLHSGLYDHQPPEILIRDVVESYWGGLIRIGHIPHHLQELIRLDLILDVQGMLRKKIYGHFDIAEYNRNRKKVRE